MAQEGPIIATAPMVDYRPAASPLEPVHALAQGRPNATGAAPAGVGSADRTDQPRAMAMAEHATASFAQTAAH
jgi:hypothetical protein